MRESSGQVVRVSSGGAGAVRAVPEEGRSADDVARIARSVLVLVAEVLAGACPPSRADRRVRADVRRTLAEQAGGLRGEGPSLPPRVLATWLQQPAPGAAETGAVLRLGDRVQAVALRLEYGRGRWRCVVLETTRVIRAAHRRAA
ncbi:Rv3235 family protein [Actinomadura flavalba]|uniref:Rv3235 family protein n=1 Tax=Actinomadura flavalba TaxID=1120938 RepID=UPI0003A5BA67|nr:Rv3235 family protein [Actinomadura flavalba]